jgi:hypothetical protein
MKDDDSFLPYVQFRRRAHVREREREREKKEEGTRESTLGLPQRVKMTRSFNRNLSPETSSAHTVNYALQRKSE